MSMRRGLALAAVAASATVALAACGSSNSAQNSSSSGPIKIGYVVNETGSMAGFDQPPSQGVDLAVADINAAGGVLGRKLEVVREDMKTDPSLAPSEALDLIHGGAVAMIAACDYDYGSPTAVTAQQKQVATVSTCAADPKFGAQGIGPYAYSMGLTDNLEGATLAQWAQADKKWGTGYVFEDTSLSYTKGLAQTFSQTYTKLGGHLAGTSTFSQEDQSIAAEITKLKSVSPQPDFLLLASYAPGLVTFIRQIRSAGINIPIVGGTGYDGTWWTGSLPGLSNVYYDAFGYVFGSQSPDKQWWQLAQKYQAKYGKAPIDGAFLTGYATVQVLAKAIEDAKSTDSVKINDALQHISMDTILGPVKFSPALHTPGTRPIPIVEFVNGKPTYQSMATATWVPNPFG
jgi:branched-chain amino acid transport system substrate-binding protein